VKRLVLFDIDGTLLSASGISARCLGEALLEVVGQTGPMHGYDYSGKTDPQIVRELMRGVGRGEEEIERRRPEVLERYARRLEASLRPEHVRAKPGVPVLLGALERDVRVSLGLLTGNLERCAHTKLAALGLAGRFAFGAFGSDREDRYELPALAVARALEATGRAFAGDEVVIVGDSIHDVLCGRDLGARAVAVATGRTSLAALRSHAPAAALQDLSDTARALEAILGA
jgi:phosphoglycolate phosphatase-like HAD superfamily hydrolase